MNPYTPPKSSVGNEEIYLKDLDRATQKELILSGRTTAGPLAVAMARNPIRFWLITFVVFALIGFGIWINL